MGLENNSQTEYDRLVRMCEADKVILPNKRQVEKKAAHMVKLVTQPMTEVGISFSRQDTN